jgi:hypothetical protein
MSSLNGSSFFGKLTINFSPYNLQANYLFNDIIYKTALYIQINEHKKCSFILKNISKCNIFTIFLPNLLKSLKYPCAFKNILGVI